MGALEGVRVLELSQGIHGPYATMLLADMGASVIKVEPPQGELNRTATVVEGTLTISSQFYACNRNKRVMCVNLRTLEGRAIVRRLALDSDVLVENMRVGVLDRLGLGYDDLAGSNPKLIYASASSYGPRGPRAHLASLDIVAQAAGGVAAHTGTPETGPLPMGSAIADHAGALWLAWGISTALFARERTGRGQRISSSLLGSQIGLQAWELSHFLLTGDEPMRAGTGHPLARGGWNIFAAADGHFGLGGVNDARFPGLCKAIAAPELLEDARFKEARERLAHSDELVAALAAHFQRSTLAELIPSLEANGQVVAPVASYTDLATDPQVLANGYVTELPTDEFGPLRMVGTPVEFSDTPAVLRSRPPDLDTHTGEVLAEMGFDDETIGSLYASGAVGAAV